jgi:bacillithiol system protein YtxJ
MSVFNYIFGKSGNQNSSEGKINWIPLTFMGQLDEIVAFSNQKPVVIFKHSTRCSISSMVKSRLERSESPEGVDFYYLDLIQYRPVSNQVAEEFSVWHESPQLLLINKGECTYDESHTGISMDELIAELSQ